MTGYRSLRIIIFSCLLLGIFFHHTSVLAYTKTSKELERISQQMAKEGNSYFILVVMYNDGLIKEGQHIHLVNENNVLSLDEKIIPEPYQSRYQKLIADFNSTVKPNQDRFFGSLQCDGVRLSDDILNPNSSLRNRPRVDTTGGAAMTAFMKELVLDKLANTSNEIVFEYNPKGLFINGRQLEAAYDKKYKDLIRELFGFVPSQERSTYRISWYP